VDDKFRVIVADDEKLIAVNIAKNIEKAHPAFRVAGIAYDGAEALKKAEELLPHVVFSDIKMPVMDGLQLFNLLSERMPNIKKVIISGYDDFQLIRNAMLSQTFDYLLKPVNREELKETLEKLHTQLCSERNEIAAEISQSPGQIAETVRRHIQENFANAIDFAAIATRYGFSGSYLTRIFHLQVGVSPQRYLIDCRIQSARQLLADTELLVREVGVLVGYADPFHFCKVFKQKTGMSPSQYRKRYPLVGKQAT
jgi:two-component system, response regulator YesN